jgi:hypothetical protein
LKNNRELEFLSLIKGKLTLKEVLATDTQNSKSIMDIAVIKELYSGTMVSPIGVISDYFRNLHSLMLLDLEYNDFIQFKSIPLCHFDIITSLVLTFLYTHTEEEIAIHIVSSDKKLCKQLEQQTEAISSHEINFYKFSELMLINTKNKKSHLIVFDAFNLNIDHLNIINLVKYTIFNLDAKAVLFVDKKHVAESVSKVATSEKMRFDNIEVKNRNEFSITAIINGINCNIALPYFLYEKKDLDSLDRRRANQLMIEIE